MTVEFWWARNWSTNITRNQLWNTETASRSKLSVFSLLLSKFCWSVTTVSSVFMFSILFERRKRQNDLLMQTKIHCFQEKQMKALKVLHKWVSQQLTDSYYKDKKIVWLNSIVTFYITPQRFLLNFKCWHSQVTELKWFDTFIWLFISFHLLLQFKHDIFIQI